MILFGLEIIVRRATRSAVPPEPPLLPVTPERATEGFREVRDAVPVDDKELARAKDAQRRIG